MMRIKRGLGAAALLLAVSCGASGSTSTDDQGGSNTSMFGTYRLNGSLTSSLPEMLYQEPGLKIEVVGGGITLSPNLTYSTNLQFRTTKGQTVTTSEWTSTGVMKGAPGAYEFYEKQSEYPAFAASVYPNAMYYAVTIPHSVIDIPNGGIQVILFNFVK